MFDGSVRGDRRCGREIFIPPSFQGSCNRRRRSLQIAKLSANDSVAQIARKIRKFIAARGVARFRFVVSSRPNAGVGSRSIGK